MKRLATFVHRIVNDFRLGPLGSKMQKTFEFRVAEMVDEQIEEALAATLTEHDWAVYDSYRKKHPHSPPKEAFDAMLRHRPEIQKTLRQKLFELYQDLMIRGEAADD